MGPFSDPRRELPVPSLATQAKGFIKSAAHVAASALRGNPIAATPAVVDFRRTTCEACPRFNLSTERCSLCGCPLKIKPWFAAAKCPDNPPRW